MWDIANRRDLFFANLYDIPLVKNNCLKSLLFAKIQRFYQIKMLELNLITNLRERLAAAYDYL